MSITVPYLQKKDAAPLKAALEETAREIGVDDYTVGIVAFTLFKKLADQVTDGKIVRIPSFGAFFPYIYARQTRSGLPDIVQPRFQAAVGFRAVVRDHCNPHAIKGGNKRYKLYRETHHEGRARNGERDYRKGLDDAREILRAKARQRGQDL